MHIYYELIDKTRTVENPVVKEMIKNNYDAKQIIECAMAQAEIRVQKNKQEQDRINEIAARFGTYLKQNGILSHNKYIEDYMEMHILNAHEEAQQANDEQAKCNARAKIKSLEVKVFFITQLKNIKKIFFFIQNKIVTWLYLTKLLEDI